MNNPAFFLYSYMKSTVTMHIDLELLADAGYFLPHPKSRKKSINGLTAYSCTFKDDSVVHYFEKFRKTKELSDFGDRIDTFFYVCLSHFSELAGIMAERVQSSSKRMEAKEMAELLGILSVESIQIILTTNPTKAKAMTLSPTVRGKLVDFLTKQLALEPQTYLKHESVPRSLRDLTNCSKDSARLSWLASKKLKSDAAIAHELCARFAYAVCQFLKQQGMYLSNKKSAISDRQLDIAFTVCKIFIWDPDYAFPKKSLRSLIRYYKQEDTPGFEN